jgi:tRNA (guanine-N7-)-methyltransferase
MQFWHSENGRVNEPAVISLELPPKISFHQTANSSINSMGQKKLVRFAEIANFNNVLQYPSGMAGNWHSFFGNRNHITLELACGKGEYTVGLARLYPDRNFIGIDVKGNRIWVGARIAIAESLKNVAFIRTQIDKITDYFAGSEVNDIWITFPDPQLRASKVRKRLTHPVFLRKYQQILVKGGYIHLKTDSPDLYDFTKKVISLYSLDLFADISDTNNARVLDKELEIKTHYESLDISGSNRIFYLKFGLTKGIQENKDAELKEWVMAEPIKAITRSS